MIDLAKRAVVRSVPLDKPPRDAEFGSDSKAFDFTEAGVSAVQVLDFDKPGTYDYFCSFHPYRQAR